MYAGKEKTSSNIAWHRPQSITYREEEELMQKSGRALAHTTDPLDKLRLLCLSKGAAGILVLGRIFRLIHPDGSNRLTWEQFYKAINETGLELSKNDAEDLFERFDHEKCGTISLDEFLANVQPPMAECRRHIVEQAWQKFHKPGDGGVIHVADIKREYAVTCNPRYLSGEETADLIMNKFLAIFETEGYVDGKVTLEEFMNYYSGISVSIESDAYFDLMIRQCFKL